MTKRTPEAMATLRDMASEGANASVIARALGVSSMCVANWARDELIPLPTKGQAMKALNADPEFKAATAARMKALNADPEFKAATAARMKALNADPEFKAATAARMKALHADPEFKAATAARMKALNADPEFKAARAARMKALHADPEFKAHLIAARKGVPDIEIPKWVPRDLWIEYLDLASEAGEEFAASRVRRLKAEMVAGGWLAGQAQNKSEAA